jgi:hypothetical protein
MKNTVLYDFGFNSGYRKEKLVMKRKVLSLIVMGLLVVVGIKVVPAAELEGFETDILSDGVSEELEECEPDIEENLAIFSEDIAYAPEEYEEDLSEKNVDIEEMTDASSGDAIEEITFNKYCTKSLARWLAKVRESLYFFHKKVAVFAFMMYC